MERPCASAATALMRAAVPAGREGGSSARAEWERFLPHVFALVEEPRGVPHDREALAVASDVLEVLAKAANYLWLHRRFHLARVLQESAHRLARQQGGDDDVMTLRAANGLGVLLQVLGERDAALDLHEDTFDRRSRLLGADHPDTLVSAHNLASALGAVGESTAAFDMHRDVLERRRRVLVEDHPFTLRSAETVARALTEHDRHEEARELFEDTLDRRRHSQGDDHPDTLVAASELARFLSDLADHAAARVLLEDVMTRRLRLLGDAHPWTLRSMRELASVLQTLGEDVRAKRLQLHADFGGGRTPESRRSAIPPNRAFW